MKNKVGVIYFSENNPDFRKQPGISADSGAGSSEQYISDRGELIELIRRQVPEMLVIDLSGFAKGSDLSGIVAEAAAQEIPMMLISGRFPEGERSARMISPEESERRRLTLRRPGEISRRRDDDRLKIVSDTAATLSHEINNPLMAITANVEMLLKSKGRLDREIVSKLQTIGSAANRIRRVTERLADLDHLRFRETSAGRMIDLEAISPGNRSDRALPH